MSNTTESELRANMARLTETFARSTELQFEEVSNDSNIEDDSFDVDNVQLAIVIEGAYGYSPIYAPMNKEMRKLYLNPLYKSPLKNKTPQLHKNKEIPSDEDPVFLFLEMRKPDCLSLEEAENLPNYSQKNEDDPKVNKLAPFALFGSKISEDSSKQADFDEPMDSDQNLDDSSSTEEGAKSLPVKRLKISNSPYSSTLNLNPFHKVTGDKRILDHLKSDEETPECSKSSKEVNGEDLKKIIEWSATMPRQFWSRLDDFKKFEESNPEGSPDFPRNCIQFIYEVTSQMAQCFIKEIKSNPSLGQKSLLRGFPFDTFKFFSENLSGSLNSSLSLKKLGVSYSKDLFERFYSIGFEAMCYEDEGFNTSITDLDTSNENNAKRCKCCKSTECICPQLVNLFTEANSAIHILGLKDELAGPRVYNVIKIKIQKRIMEKCIGKYESSHLNELTEWLESKMLPWVQIVYPTMEGSVLPEMEKEFKYILHEFYGKTIINEMFSIIIDFPESQPILEDLKNCMKVVPLRTQLVTKLKAALDRRLLNAGVNTSDVLEAYVSTVRALKIVDPSGILIQLVTPSVRDYLKLRDETVRVILVSLTEESGDLAEELLRNPVFAERKIKIIGSNWNEWEPDPIDVPKDTHNLRKSDLIHALVSIYGSKSLFIDEYRALLADRLLKMTKPTTTAITREIKCLELLKLRFGESELQKCEVMLKDVSDSQRLNVRFYEEEEAILANEDVHVTGLIVSAQFWPAFKPENLEIPQVITEAFEKYTKAFEMIKGNRTLEWQKHIGNVEIELESNDGTKATFNVNPTQASIIYMFQEKETWELKDLCKKLCLSQVTLRSRISFWISKGILYQSSPDVYKVSEGINPEEKATGVNLNKFMDEAEMYSPMTSTSTQREEELQMFWSYIEGMLTNLDSLPLSRIHSMLKLFATVECSLEELQKFLDSKVTQNHLVYSGGNYQLPK